MSEQDIPDPVGEIRLTVFRNGDINVTQEYETMARENRRRAEIGRAVLAQVNEDGFAKRPLDADGWQMICPICTGSPASGHSDNCPFPFEDH